MSTSPLVIFVPTHGRPTLLRRTLESISACDHPENYAECVVVENGVPAGAEEIVEIVAIEHPHVALRYLHHERANKSSALNAALGTAARDALCVFFDDDVRVGAGTLVAYAAAAGGETGRYFGGPIACDYEVPPAPWLSPSLPLSARGFGAEEAAASPFFVGLNWAAFAADIRGVGGFDPEFGPGSPTGARGQETEAQKALLDAGVTAEFVPGAGVWHYVPRERSSFAWALRRKYAVGLMVGQQERAAQNPTSTAQHAFTGLRLAIGGVASGTAGRTELACRRVMDAAKHFGAAVAAARGD